MRIDSGQLATAKGKSDYELANVIGQWQSVAHGRFPDDCSKLLQIIEETDELRLWEKKIGGFQYKSRNEFLQHHVLINFDLTEANVVKIVESLKRGDFADAQQVIRQKVAEAKEKPLAEHGEIGNGRKDESRPYNIRSTKFGTDTTYTLRRLARDAPELLEKIEAGELSVNAAAIQAGIRKKATPEDVCLKAFAKVEDRVAVARSIVASLTDDERAQL